MSKKVFSKTMFFVGRVLPASDPNLPNKELSPNDFNVENAKEMKLAGHPIYDEHCWDKSKGKILYSFTNHDNTKFILGKLNDKELQNQVRTGEKRELSLTHHFSVNIKDDGTEIQTRIPLEVSLTKKGNRPNCDIIHFFDQHVFPNSSASYLNNMSAEQPTQTQPAAPAATPEATPAAPSEPTPIDYDSMDATKVIEALKAEGMTADEAFLKVVEMTRQLRQLNTQVGHLSEEKEDLEAVRRIQEQAAVDAYADDLRRQGINVNDDMKKIFLDMVHQQPQNMQVIMANAKTSAEYISEQDRQLKNYREQEARKREKRGARGWLNSTTHRVGSASSGPSGMFKNSAYDRVVNAQGQQAIRAPFVSEATQPYAQGMSTDEFKSTLSNLL